MLIPKADRKKIHETLFREGVLCAAKYATALPTPNKKNLTFVSIPESSPS